MVDLDLASERQGDGDSEATVINSECATDPPVQSVISVEVVDEGMLAILRVESANPTATGIRDVLTKAGVIFGILEDEIENIANEGLVGLFEIARGTRPISGSGAVIRYLFRADPFVPKPTIREDGSVDFLELGAVENVKVDQPLAQKEPAIPGEPGSTVKGKVLDPPKMSDVAFKAGNGATVSGDGLEVRASIDGRPVFRFGEITVSPVFLVPGDCDLGCGNIDFDGTIQVEGDVNASLSLRATHDIVVKGSTEMAHLEALGDVIVGGGLLKQSHVVARGNVSLGFAEHSHVSAAGKVLVKGSVLFCELSSGSSIIVNKAIIGGSGVAASMIEAQSYGNRAETPTRLIVDPYKPWEAELQAWRARLREIDVEIAAIEPSRPNSDLAQVAQKKTDLKGEAASINSSISQLEGKIAALRSPEISALQCIHPGISIEINKAVANTLSKLTEVRLREAEGQVVYAYGPGKPFQPISADASNWRFDTAAAGPQEPDDVKPEGPDENKPQEPDGI